VTANFPGPGRAFVQWGTSSYQMGWQNVFLFGDTDAGVNWLIATINGGAPAPASVEVASQIATGEPKASSVAKLEAGPSIKTYDSIVAVDSSADGQTMHVALYDGSVSAYDASGKQLWTTPVLLEGAAMRVNSKGDRLAVAGYPGVQVLDAKSGKILGGFTAAPRAAGNTALANLMVDVAWNTAGTRVAAGWSNNTTVAGPRDVQDFVIIDADGKATPVKGVEGNVMGVAFVPNSDTVIVGADKLTAVNSANGQILWSNPDLKGARAFAFSADNATLAAGGWDRKIASVNLTDGKTIGKAVELPAVIGGVVLTPSKDIIAAVWGGTNPLTILKSGAEKPEPLFKSRFGFQDVAWSAKSNALVAAEQGGKVWVLGLDGQPKAMLDEEAGTTVYDLRVSDNGLLLGRMNRIAQRVALP
jgi:WD40 repeat protein